MSKKPCSEQLSGEIPANFSHVESVHVSAYVPARHVEALSVLARTSERSFSAELRLAIADRLAAHAQRDDDPPGRAGRVEDSSAGTSRAAA